MREAMNVVMIVPTGLGCSIGGHAGDAAPAARLLASACDKLIIHPNVVNASDINEMPANSLYVEGGMLDRFLEGEIELQPVRSNRVLVAANAPIDVNIINAVNGAHAAAGISLEIVELSPPLIMRGSLEDGRAVGEVDGWESVVQQVQPFEFDALAVTTPVQVDEQTALEYLRCGSVNPWGAVEAKASRLISMALNKPVAHAPAPTEQLKEFDEVVDPRKAAEMVSVTYLFCILKGLHHAPRIGLGISAGEVDCLVTPVGCWGRPHAACARLGIPIIGVAENEVTSPGGWEEWDRHLLDANVVLVQNYWESAGYILAMRAGVAPESTRRPLAKVVTIHKAEAAP